MTGIVRRMLRKWERRDFFIALYVKAIYKVIEK